MIEYAYEEKGLAVLETRADGKWLRVRYGMEGSKALTGWTRTVEHHVAYDDWTSLVLGRGGSVGGARSPLLETPGGRPVPLSYATANGSAALYPITVQGPWMLLRVVAPTDACDVPAPHTRETYAWMRFLSDQERPYLNYAPRGC